MRVCMGCGETSIPMLNLDEDDNNVLIQHVVFDAFREFDLKDDYTQYVLAHINLMEGKIVIGRTRDLLLEWCWREIAKTKAGDESLYRQCSDALHNKTPAEGLARNMLLIRCQQRIIIQQAKDTEPRSKGLKSCVQKNLVTVMDSIMAASLYQCSIDEAIMRLPEVMLRQLADAGHDIDNESKYEALKKAYIRADNKHNVGMSQSMNSALKRTYKDSMSKEFRTALLEKFPEMVSDANENFEKSLENNKNGESMD